MTSSTFHVVVMGSENLKPQTIANSLSSGFQRFVSRENNNIKCQEYFYVETACIPKPYIPPAMNVSNDNKHNKQQHYHHRDHGSSDATSSVIPTLDAAVVLFSPMRPLSFVRLDAFVDRVVHIPGIKIILLAVDVDVLGSDAAVNSLRHSSRCRPVQIEDVQRYVLLKRKWLTRIDEQEQEMLQQQLQSTFGGGGFGGGSRKSSQFQSSVSFSLAHQQQQQQKHLHHHHHNNLLDSESSFSSRELVVVIDKSGTRRSTSSPSTLFFRGFQNSSSSSSSLLDQQQQQPSSPTLVSFERFQELIKWWWYEKIKMKTSQQQQQKEEEEEDKKTVSNNKRSSRENSRERSVSTEKRDDDDDDNGYWNDGIWQQEWKHEVEVAKSFFDQQKFLFDSHHSTSSTQTQEQMKVQEVMNAAHEWVIVSLRGLDSSSSSSNLLLQQHNKNNFQTENSSAAAAAQQLTASVSFSSPALLGNNNNNLLSLGDTLRRNTNLNASSSTSQQRERGGGKSFTVNFENHPVENENELISSLNSSSSCLKERFAFWNPKTNQVSLSIPKALVAHTQHYYSAYASSSLFDEKEEEEEKEKEEQQKVTEKEKEKQDDEEEEKEKTNKKKNTISSRATTTTTSLQQLISCETHIARKAMATAAELRKQDKISADKAAVQQLNDLQKTLTLKERKHRQLQMEIRKMKQQREAAKVQREAIKKQVFDVQKKLISTKMKLENISSGKNNNNFHFDPEHEALQDKFQSLQHSQSSLSTWYNSCAEKWQSEIDEYQKTGGRSERSRLYLAKFLDNQQIRSDINVVVEYNNEIQEEIDLCRQCEWNPLHVRHVALERRKQQLLEEINDLVLDDMKKSVSFSKVLDSLKHKKLSSEILNFSDDNDGNNNISDEIENEDDWLFGSDNDDESSSSNSSSSRSSSSSSDSSSETDERSENINNKKNSKRSKPKKLFQDAIYRLRQEIRQTQQVLHSDKVETQIGKLAALSRSPFLFQILEIANNNNSNNPLSSSLAFSSPPSSPLLMNSGNEAAGGYDYFSPPHSPLVSSSPFHSSSFPTSPTSPKATTTTSFSHHGEGDNTNNTNNSSSNINAKNNNKKVLLQSKFNEDFKKFVFGFQLSICSSDSLLAAASSSNSNSTTLKSMNKNTIIENNYNPHHHNIINHENNNDKKSSTNNNITIITPFLEKKWIVLLVEEILEREQMLFEETIERMHLNSCAVIHARNMSVKAISFAKAKRKALFG